MWAVAYTHLTNTLTYAVITAPVSIVLALIFAYLLNDKVHLKKFNRTCFFIPYISSMVALTAVFRFLFRSDSPINAILVQLFHVAEDVYKRQDLNGVLEDFQHDEAYLWLQEHAEEYGFVLRYPEGKSDITKIIYEPWHFRYVGPEHAKEMNRLGMCLEEYVEYLKEKMAETD